MDGRETGRRDQTGPEGTDGTRRDQTQDARREDGRRETGAGDGRRETGDGRRQTADGRRETGGGLEAGDGRHDGRQEKGDGRRETKHAVAAIFSSRAYSDLAGLAFVLSADLSRLAPSAALARVEPGCTLCLGAQRRGGCRGGGRRRDLDGEYVFTYSL
eukprot:5466569-Prymnesium_polylepis.1